MVFGKGEIPPPTPWRVTAWVFLILGAMLYILAVWLLFQGSVAWAIGAGVVGYLLRRQVRMVAPQLMERIAIEIGAEEDNSIG